MRKMNRDISDARPDITHQVCLLHLAERHIELAHVKSSLVPPDFAGFPNQQGWETSDLHPYRKRGSY